MLVPLDGSELSNSVVARARHILHRPGISVTFLRVIECGEDRENDLAYQMDSRHQPVCKALAGIREGFEERSVNVSTDIRFGDPAAEILREIAEANHQLVLMNTCGQGGAGRARLGSVAQRVLQSSPVPLLLFRPRMGSDGALSPPEAFEMTRFRQILVSLDGSKSAEEIIPVAEQVARTLGSELRLFRAVRRGSKEKVDRLRAGEYLKETAASLASRGVDSRADVRTGKAAQSALALVREDGIDMVALTTHARKGLARVMHGSVTQELLGGADVPILTLCNLRHRHALPASALDHRHVRVG